MLKVNGNWKTNQAREVDLSFDHVLHVPLETGTFASLRSPGTSHILRGFTKNIDNNPAIISEIPFNAFEAIQLCPKNLDAFKVNENSCYLLIFNKMKFLLFGVVFLFLLLEKWFC